MDVISQRELRNNSAAVMDGVEAGKSFLVTRNGVQVAELRPLAHPRRTSAEDLVARHRQLPRVDVGLLRAEADEFFGTDDRVGDDETGAGPGG